jgi:DNA-directed RNA polymerase subunit RPC12/RpoP
VALILNCGKCGKDYDTEPGHTGIHFVEGRPSVVYLCAGCAKKLREWLGADG